MTYEDFYGMDAHRRYLLGCVRRVNYHVLI